MKKKIFPILILFTSKIFAQDSSAYSIFNSVYANDSLSNSLTEMAVPFRLNTNRDSLFLSCCSKIVPDSVLKSMLEKQSKAFKWEENRLNNTFIVADSIALKHEKEYLTLSAPIFDVTMTYAIVFESLDAVSCIHSGPVLLHYKDEKWEVIEQNISSYLLARGHIRKR